MPRKNSLIAIVVVCALIVLAGILYERIVPSLSSARTDQSQIETAIATWLLHQSVSEKAKERPNPVGTDPAEIAAGRDLFRQKCEICHAYDGSGKTQIGAGEYPRPPPLRVAVASISDGEMFYHIRNGIRNTGMPAWDLPDRQIWQLVVYIRSLPIVAPLDARAAATVQREPVAGAYYVGSAACQTCHQDIYARWSKSRMTNVVRDPREHPDAIIPDLSKPDPLLTFSKDDIAFVYGSRWKQRYFTKRGDDYFPQPVQWDVTHKMWKRYFVPNNADWWAPLYPPDNFKRPTGPLCDGCHSVNYDIANQKSQRMERRLRKVSWTGQRACGATSSRYDP
jgi:mono/diheme cytochrome c family protein